MNKRIIAVITAVLMTAAIFTACGDKTTETSAAETAAPVVETTVAETSEETVAETMDTLLIIQRISLTAMTAATALSGSFTQTATPSITSNTNN